ncbi:MAG: hypothetical protein ACK501_04850 [Planctomycetota bacterium]
MKPKVPAFPVGLYGMLLFALCWLTLPTVFAPVERLLVGASCLVPRLWAGALGSPAHAGASDERQASADLRAALSTRVEAADGDALQARFGRELLAVHCAVLAAQGVGRRSARTAPVELVLDRSYAELAECERFVTKGDKLVGYLLQPGRGIASADRPEDPARVALLSHPSSAPFCAALVDEGGGELRMVVRPAAVVDPAPLRVDLWDDPYRAARLGRSGNEVRTLALAGDDAPLPDGLLVGSSVVWGYPQKDGGDALTLGVFVQPPFDPRALSSVVAWRRNRGDGDTSSTSAKPLPAGLPGIVYDLPGAAQGRHLLVVDDGVAAGAVVHDGHFVGLAHGLAFGCGLVTSFAASRHRWSLLLLPDDPSLAPEELDAEVIGADANVATLRLRSARPASRGPLPAGQLFTGSNGRDCPAGLWVGHAEPHPNERSWFVVVTATAPGPRQVEVLRGGER